MLSHYDVLGVEPTADVDTIRHAWRIRVRLLHPDHHIGAPDDVRAEAVEETLRLNAAWQALKDPERRHRYDLHLARLGGWTPGRTRTTWSDPRNADDFRADASVACSVHKRTGRVRTSARRPDRRNRAVTWPTAFPQLLLVLLGLVCVLLGLFLFMAMVQ